MGCKAVADIMGAERTGHQRPTPKIILNFASKDEAESMADFVTRLARACEGNQSLVCVGLDPVSGNQQLVHPAGVGHVDPNLFAVKLYHCEKPVEPYLEPALHQVAGKIHKRLRIVLDAPT